ncbi:MAG: DUF4178 domain-containing protein [Clostridia bacterium]|nr:DUF4178 domain-containing protein [Clostridia bacterium]
MKDLLNLEYNQEIIIEKKTYIVKAMLKFIEDSSYWLEYILQEKDGSEIFYLDVEPIGKYALHKMTNLVICPQMEVTFDGEKYELFQKGNAKIETYFGYTDVGLKENVEYFEYKCKDKLLTIEKWPNMTEVSFGKYVDKSKIKVKKIEEDNFRL